ncbi:MAG: hypothetical protein IKC71_00945 [Clostridia bacterium]|nr:hypothetical protein [Clostridia bacterium]
MQLLVITMDNSEEFLKTLSGLKDHGMNGIVIPTTSLKHALFSSNIDAAPIFGSISKLVDHDYELSHTVMMLVHHDKLEVAKEVVKGIVKEFGEKGIMFSVPVTFWEGIE